MSDIDAQALDRIREDLRLALAIADAAVQALDRLAEPPVQALDRLEWLKAHAGETLPEGMRDAG